MTLSIITLIIFLYSQSIFAADTVGKWHRHVIELVNSTYSGNPFELQIEATFKHSDTGDTIKLPGYYAGSNTWKVGFMPTIEGEWTYVTNSSDPELHDKAGSVIATSSNLPGLLKADPSHPRKWKFSDGGYITPIQLRMEIFSEPASLAEFSEAADFLKANNLTIFETRLLEENGQFGGRYDFIFEGDWREHQFDLTIWDRMEERMDALAERGLGAHIMFYSDDGGEPNWSGQSETEKLVIRYAIARLAGYPVVIFNTGIDIAEYRDQSWVNWFGDQVRQLDPYDHPVSSRYGGGSGSMVMASQNFHSHGDRKAYIDDQVDYFESSSIPVSMDDAWGENRPSHESKNFSPEDIRRAFWKNVIAGGLGGLIRGSEGFFYINSMQEDLESEQWLKLIYPFVTNKLGSTFGTMVPSPSLVSGAYCLSDPQRNKILYFLMGNDDRWNPDDGGDITVNLANELGNYQASWFDTRNGSESSAGQLAGGKNHDIQPPSSDDWILLLNIIGDDNNTSPPNPPSNVQGDVLVQ